jgi:hypothetical protein
MGGFNGRKVKYWERNDGGSFKLLPKYFSDGIAKGERQGPVETDNVFNARTLVV